MIYEWQMIDGAWYCLQIAQYQQEGYTLQQVAEAWYCGRFDTDMDIMRYYPAGLGREG